jgi:hypothetical protein
MRQANHAVQAQNKSVLFVNSGDVRSWVDTLWRAQLDHEEQIVFEHACSRCACHHFTESSMPQVAINSLWWDLAHADLKSELASTCGCEDHESRTCEAE